MTQHLTVARILGILQIAHNPLPGQNERFSFSDEFQTSGIKPNGLRLSLSGLGLQVGLSGFDRLALPTSSHTLIIGPGV
jgi:hypothetical protein